MATSAGRTGESPRDEVRALQEQLRQLEETVRAQRHDLDRQAARIDELLATRPSATRSGSAPAPVQRDDAAEATSPPSNPAADGPAEGVVEGLDRRRLLRSGGLAAGALAGTAALSVLGASPAAAATVGGLTLLDYTTRIYDSRANLAPIGVAKGKWSNEQRLVDTTLNASGIVAGTAKAVLVNLAVTNTVAGGFGAAFRTGIAWPGNASVNWSATGVTASNLAVVAVDDKAEFVLKIAGTADVIIDAIGFYS